MRTTFCILLLGALAFVAIADTNVSGKWSGTYSMKSRDGETNEGTALLVLKQTGSDISGTVGPNEGEQHTITGKIEGDKITFVTEGEGRTIKFDLVLIADRITGDVNLSLDGQQTAKGKLDVKRAK